MTEKPVRRYELDSSRIQDLEDVKKILDGLQLRINTDDLLYDSVSHLFTTEVVPIGYAKLIEVVGEEEISKMTYEEIEQKIIELLQNEQTN
jgi:hypothetical protein